MIAVGVAIGDGHLLLGPSMPRDRGERGGVEVTPTHRTARSWDPEHTHEGD